MWEYTEKVMDHFLNPRNVGEVEKADAVGEVGNIACGDALRLTLKIEDGKIVDAKFRTFGCASAIASSSVLTELVKGKSVEEAKKITNDDIVRYLGGLPGEKLHCSVMGQEALEAAIAHYNGEEVKPHDHGIGIIVCSCFNVTDAKIEAVVKEHGLKTVEEVTNYTKAGGACGKCVKDIKKILDKINSPAGSLSGENSHKPLTNIQKMKLIEEVIAKEIRPLLQKDKGDIELIDIAGSLVTVRLKGVCSNCPGSGRTIKNTVEFKLREKVDPTLVVETG